MGCKSGFPSTGLGFMTVFKANGVLLSDITSGQEIRICSSVLIEPVLEITDLQSFSITLEWSTIYDSDFIIERSQDGTNFTELETVSNVREYTDNTVDQGFNYWYRIKATNGETESPYSNVVTALTPLDIDPPIGLLLQPNFAAFDLSLVFSESGGDGFNVYRSTDGVNFSLIGQAPPPTSQLNYRDNTIESGITYYYRVTIYKNEGETAPSSIASGSITFTLYGLDDFACDDIAMDESI